MWRRLGIGKPFLTSPYHADDYTPTTLALSLTWRPMTEQLEVSDSARLVDRQQSESIKTSRTDPQLL